jgi:predicted DNA-binding protein (UPF0251 family)
VITRDKEAESIRLFHAQKWRVGTIADQLGVHHTTVQRVLEQAGARIRRALNCRTMTDEEIER